MGVKSPGVERERLCLAVERKLRDPGNLLQKWHSDCERERKQLYDKRLTIGLFIHSFIYDTY